MIGRKKRDVKFIIYQSLYIFVIAYLAMKGATILSAGEEQEKNHFDTTISKTELEELAKNNTFIDSNEIIIPKDSLDDLNRLLVDAQKISKEGRYIVPPPPPPQTSQKEIAEEQKEPESKSEEKKTEAPKVDQKFKQYQPNTIKNPSPDKTMDVYDGSTLLASIPPGGQATVTLRGQKKLTFKYR